MPRAAQPFFEAALEDLALALSSREGSLEMLTAGPPDRTALDAALAAAAQAAAIAVPEPVIAPVPAIDWVSHTNKLLAPFRAGRFFLFGKHDAGRTPAGAWPLQIEAGLAFGTGRAPSTLGCLLAIDRFARRRRFRRALDIGCGSGVLALAMARAGARAVAVDNDPIAIAVTRENAAINGLHIASAVSDGTRAPLVAAHAPYDMITANILAAPLRRMAGPISVCLARGGHLVLSGLLAKEEREVHDAYRARHLRFVGRIALDGWHTLIWRRP